MTDAIVLVLAEIWVIVKLVQQHMVVTSNTLFFLLLKILENFSSPVSFQKPNIMKFIVFLILLINSIYSYSQNKETKVIPLKHSTRYEHELKLSDIAKQVTYIPLETNDNCLIGKIYSFTLAKEFIFVNNGGIILQFSLKGKFIRQLNKNGQGPGEGTVANIALDEENRLIYFQFSYTYDIIVFNFEGKHIKTIKNPFAKETIQSLPVGGMIVYNENILFAFSNENGQMPYKYAVVNSNGEILHKEINYEKYFLKERIRESSILPPPFFCYNSSVFFKHNYNDTIFKINQDHTCSPLYVCDLSKQITLEEDMKAGAFVIKYSELSGRNKINVVRESDEYIYVYHTNSPYDNDNRKSFFSQYNKLTRQLLPNINRIIINDWDGGMDVRLYSNQSGSTVCFRIQPFEIKEKLTNEHFSKSQPKYPTQKDALKKLVNGLLEDDNPVLMIIELK